MIPDNQIAFIFLQQKQSKCEELDVFPSYDSSIMYHHMQFDLYLALKFCKLQKARVLNFQYFYIPQKINWKDRNVPWCPSYYQS